MDLKKETEEILKAIEKAVYQTEKYKVDVTEMNTQLINCLLSRNSENGLKILNKSSVNGDGFQRVEFKVGGSVTSSLGSQNSLLMVVAPESDDLYNSNNNQTKSLIDENHSLLLA